MLKNYRQLATFIFIVFLSCQGPWSYYPENPETYQGIWTYAYIVSGRPVENVCLDKIHSLNEVRMHGFAFYESAAIKVSGSFNGKDTSFFLKPDTANYAHNPNCFVGPKNLTADAGKNYELNISITWDSAGTRVISQFNAKTYIPKKFKIQRAYDLEGNQFNKGYVIMYLPPPMDLKSNYFIPEYSDDVGGVHVSIVYGNSDDIYFGDNIFWGENSIDKLIENFAEEGSDTARHARFGDRRTLYTAKNQQIGNINKDMDSIPILGINMPAATVFLPIKLLFYASTPDYFKFDDTFINGRMDSRIEPIYNIQGGAGIFAGMLVDTFDIYIKPAQGIKLYSYYDAQDAYCRTEDFNHKIDNYKVRKECIEVWDAIIRCEITYGKSENNTICLGPEFFPEYYYEWYEIPIESLKETLSKEEFITWCEYRNFPIEIYPPCGSAMVLYSKSGKSSPILDREVKKWCEENKAVPECNS